MTPVQSELIPNLRSIQRRLAGHAHAIALRRSSLQGARLTVPLARAPDAARQSRLVVRAGQLMGGKKVNKVVLAYSGGLDTSVILTWLRDTYDCEVVTFTADLGQVGLNEMKLAHSMQPLWFQRLPPEVWHH